MTWGYTCWASSRRIKTEDLHERGTDTELSADGLGPDRSRGRGKVDSRTSWRRRCSKTRRRCGRRWALTWIGADHCCHVAAGARRILENEAAQDCASVLRRVSGVCSIWTNNHGDGHRHEGFGKQSLESVGWAGCEDEP